jgi:hypothetical protein
MADRIFECLLDESVCKKYSINCSSFGRFLPENILSVTMLTPEEASAESS